LLPTWAQAFQPCPAGTSPCPGAIDLLGYWIGPVCILIWLARWLMGKVKSRLIKGALACAFALAALFITLLALTAFGAFLAPCSEACWLRQWFR
jgi:hypothetical protein